MRDLEDSFQVTDSSDEVHLSSDTLPVDVDGYFGATQREHARLRGSVYVLLNVLAHGDYEAAAMQFPQCQQLQQRACHWPLHDLEDMEIC